MDLEPLSDDELVPLRMRWTPNSPMWPRGVPFVSRMEGGVSVMTLARLLKRLSIAEKSLVEERLLRLAAEQREDPEARA